MDYQRPEPKWAIVLDVLYDRDKELDQTFDYDNEKVSHISRRLSRKLTEQQIENTIEYMDNVGLVEGYGSREPGAFQLTSKGFDVAHERELDKAEADRVSKQHNQQLATSRKQTNLNGVLAGLTVVLALSAVIQTIISLPIIQDSSMTEIHWVLVALAATLVGFAVLTVLYPRSWQEFLSQQVTSDIG
jgi:hypothetical protein